LTLSARCSIIIEMGERNSFLFINHSTFSQFCEFVDREENDMHTYHHALTSVKKWGGKPTDYQPIHDWFDATKETFADFRHRALRHHAQGIFECERVFGTTITNSDGKEVPVRYIGEQHVKEDCGGIIPTVSDWFRNITPKSWMSRGYDVIEEKMI
jgi:hypothetical protein